MDILFILKTLKMVGSPIIKRLSRNENIETRLFKKTDFSLIVESDIELINDILLNNDIGKIDCKSLCNFFKYPDIKDFIGKIYAPNQSDPLGFLDINKIYSEFASLVIKYFKLENYKARSFSTKLFDILIEGCNESLTKLIDDGETQPHNASFNYTSFREQYQKIRKIYKSLNDYKSNPDYLSRKVCSAENYNSNFFLSGNLDNIIPTIEKYKHISLLSDGGMGKTTELKQIAYHYSQSNDPFYPIFVSLNKYTNKSISEYFPDYWELIPENELLVILDGFDEIQSKNRMDSIREIEQFVEKYPEIHVIASCRNNFYNIGTENISASLSDFKSYILVELEYNEIENYVKNKVNSRSKEFFTSIYRHNLYDLLKNPFYLINLTELFIENHVLPTSKAEIFTDLLDSRIQLDVEHYRTTRELNQDKNKIIDTLEIIALSMECLSRNYITDDDFKQLVPDDFSRELINYCTTWKKQDKNEVTWQFEHNNFQEYLAAKKLSTLPIETIKKYISFEPDYDKINPSWISTISFLISLCDNQDLLDWILTVDPKICTKFEFDKIDELKRIQMFKEIFGEYKTKNILIGGVWFESYELARFGQSDEIIDFLLNECQDDVHYTTIVNSIELLCEFEINTAKRDDIKEFLIKYALDNNCHELVQYYTLRCLSIHKFNSEETINQILPTLKLSENERIRSGLYYFLSNSDYLDEYTDVFLYGVNLVLDRDVLSSSEFTYLLKGLNETKSPESINKILTFFTNNIEYLDQLYHQDEIQFLNNSADAYLEDSSILDSCLELLKVYSQKYGYLNRNETILNFFETTGTRLDAFKKLYSNRSEEKHPFMILADLADLSCLKFIIEEHKEDKITEDEMWNFKHLLNFTNKEMSILFNNLINENFENRFIPPQEVDSSGEKRSVPNDIDLLFKKELFIEEVEKVFETDAKQEFTSEELILLRIDLNFSNLVIHTLIKVANKETVSLKIALDYISKLNWDLFCVDEIHDKLERNEEFHLSKNQKTIMSDWCISNLANVDFKQSITKTEQRINAKHKAIISWSFLRKFDFTYPKSTLLDMISFDWLEKGHFVGIEYLEMQLDVQDMKKRVLENLDEGIENDFVLSNHIVFCKKHNIKKIIEYSLDIIVDENRDYSTRKLALDTTSEMLDTFSELEEILPNIQDKFKWTVVRELMDKNGGSCESYLLNIIGNDDEENQLKAAGHLMELQNLKGIEFYVNWVIKHNKYPYYDIGSPLRTLNRSESIPYLLELLKISYREDLDQDRFHPLYRDILEAFSNVALRSEDDFIKVKKCIEQFIEENSTEIENVVFLHSNLENLEFKFYMGKNENINLDIVIEKLKENGIY